jgi:hypothetical protein
MPRRNLSAKELEGPGAGEGHVMTAAVAQQIFAGMSAEEWEGYRAALEEIARRYRDLPPEEAHARRRADLTGFLFNGFCRVHDGCGRDEGRGEIAF